LCKKGTLDIYYYCRAHYCHWIVNPCTYNKFIPGSWDDEIWLEICSLVSNNEWVEQQLTVEASRYEATDKLILIEQTKISQTKAKINMVQDGWERGFYSPDQMTNKMKEYRELISKAEFEIASLQTQKEKNGLTGPDVTRLREELVRIRAQNLSKASFEDRANLMAILGIQIIPAEDLKSRRVCCRLNLPRSNKEMPETGFAKVTFGGPFWTRTRDPSLIRTVL
jgi:hypothetical protein